MAYRGKMFMCLKDEKPKCNPVPVGHHVNYISFRLISKLKRLTVQAGVIVGCADTIQALKLTQRYRCASGMYM